MAEAVRNYLLNSEYPEVFSKKQYRISIENLIVADLDGDGVPEVIHCGDLPAARARASIAGIRRF